LKAGRIQMKGIIRAILKVTLKVLFRVRVTGLERNINARRLLIVANHESFLDGLLLGLFLPYDPVFVVYTGVTRVWFFRQVLKLADHLTVDPANPMAIKTVLKLVESGRPVMIFPEGRLTVTGSLMKVYEGPAFVAAKSGATLLQVRLDGPARSYFSRLGGKLPRRLFPRVTLTVLPATSLPMPPGETSRKRRHRAGEALRRMMQAMLFETQPRQTLYSGLLDVISVHGRRRKVAEDVKQVEYSYGDLLKMTLALGRLVERNSAPGARVGILMPNLAATVCMMMGAGARGRVPAMLNYKAGAGGMRDACTAAGIRTVFASRAFVEQAKLQADVAALRGIEILYVEDLRATMTWRDQLWVLAGMLFPRRMEAAPDPEAIAVVLFTSGSEDKPKGVALSHRALLANIAQIRSVTDFSPSDKVLNALPIFHSFGLTGGALLPLLSGMNLFLYPTPLHYRVIPEIAYDRSCSILFGTSTFLGNYARFAHPYDFYRLRYVIAGAEKLSDAVRSEWMDKFGIRILEGYGATETAPVLSCNTPMAYRAGSVGQLLPGIAARVAPVPGIDHGGLLYVRGPNLLSGYYRFEAPGVLQPPASALGPGWYETGDVVTIDEDGFVFIAGRVKRFAKIAGEMVSLETVEKLAAQASPAALHAASAHADGARGEALVLFTTDPALGREALAAAARLLGIPEIAVPRKIRHIDALPLLGTGKTDYVTLKRYAETL
jgi:acyl-[acyl-carrier-protein]-phospholipid O-acyltransferase / long-chain-fatty-acid--[acyl-carrier-protein] ligase